MIRTIIELEDVYPWIRFPSVTKRTSKKSRVYIEVIPKALNKNYS